MAFPGVYKTKEEAPEFLREHLIPTKDGKFVVDITPSDGYAFENIEGLKSSLAAERTKTKELEKAVETASSEAKALQDKYDKLLESSSSDKIEERIKAAKEQMQKLHSEELKKAQDRVAAMTEQFRNVLIRSEATAAIAKTGASVKALLPHVESRVKMVEDGNGGFRVVVPDDKGNNRIADSSGREMGIADVIAELQADPDFKMLFPSQGKGGSGAGAGGSSPNGVTHGGVRIISREDRATASASIEDIASGKAIME